MRNLFSFVLLLLGLAVSAQDASRYADHVYLSNIKSVKFHHEGLFTSEPLIDLRGGGQLVLSFDDILGGDITYKYRIIHCDRNWQPSEMDFSEYMEGFNDGKIRQWYYSSGTKLDYTHYELKLPNNDVQWTLSGNYLLEVIDTEEDKVALTRRFMVVDPRVTVQAEVRRPTRADQIRTHQQIKLTVNNKNYEILNPQRDLSVTVLQNGRWDNALTDIRPQFVNGDVINFDFTNALVFTAGRQNRAADIRTLRSAGPGIHSIDKRNDGYDVLMQLDEDRSYKSTFDYDDLNGHYIIETFDRRDPKTDADYANVHFGLVDRNPSIDSEVYFVGEFTDWQCRPEYRMQYDTTHQGYYGKALLKQGYYDYQYVRKTGDKTDYTYYEGNDYQTTNDYIVLVYLRRFGERYDRLIGASSVSSSY